MQLRAANETESSLGLDRMSARTELVLFVFAIVTLLIPLLIITANGAKNVYRFREVSSIINIASRHIFFYGSIHAANT